MNHNYNVASRIENYLKEAFILLVLFLSILSCQPTSQKAGKLVANISELDSAIQVAQPGDVIAMKNGIWNDVQIRFTGSGTSDKPITLRAESSGEVFIQGVSDLKFGGKYLVVEGLHFKSGRTPSNAVVEFKIDDAVANNCRITQCVIEDYNQLQREKSDRWIQFYGRNNQMDHCYLAGKSNRGPTVRVDLEGNESIKNYHKITNNHFGPRPPKGGPSAETIQIGNSYTSMAPSYTMVANNLFDRCNGEVEVISSKTNFNEFRNNVFYKCEGSLVTRHGNYCTVDANYFIGDPDSENIGGIRIIGSGHWITNNYFYNLKGKNFRSPLAVMNGIPKSPLNRYIQVTDVVVAYNSWIDCTSPWQFGVGSNVSQKDVLPPSEIRSATPIRTTVANNLIYNNEGDESPIIKHDDIKGINFYNNIINNQGIAFDDLDGLQNKNFEVSKVGEELAIPSTDLSDMQLYSGFEFEKITKDLFDQSRLDNNTPGAIVKAPGSEINLLDNKKYGASWYSAGMQEASSEIVEVSPQQNDLVEQIAAATPGTTVNLTGGTYQIKESIAIDKRITIKSKDENNKAKIVYSGPTNTPLFSMNPKGELNLDAIVLEGGKTLQAFAPLEEGMSSLYNLEVSDCEVSNFDYILKAFRYSFSEHISFANTSFSDCNNGIKLAEEIDDRGNYNAENLTITNCKFSGVKANVVNYYRGGYDESTVGGNLVVTNNTFTGCGTMEKSGILLNTYGIINVDIKGNSFVNNPVNYVALLWGAKNNSHSQNTFDNSASIIVEENLKQKLLY